MPLGKIQLNRVELRRAYEINKFEDVLLLLTGIYEEVALEVVYFRRIDDFVINTKTKDNYSALFEMIIIIAL